MYLIYCGTIASSLFSQKVLLWIADLQKDAIGKNIHWDKVIDEFEANYE